MRVLLILIAVLFSSACTVEAVTSPPEWADTDDTNGTDSEDTDTGSPDTDGECGEVTFWDLTLEGKIIGSNGQAVSGATVLLEDRGWNPGTIQATATTRPDGTFTLTIDDLASVIDCWGTLLNYWMIATEGDRAGERGVNMPLHDAILTGTLHADIREAPMTIQ